MSTATPLPYGIYQHYKTKGFYIVCGTAIHHHTRQLMVRYWSLSTREENVRPLHGWPEDPGGFLDMVEHDGQTVPRFAYVTNVMHDAPPERGGKPRLPKSYSKRTDSSALRGRLNQLYALIQAEPGVPIAKMAEACFGSSEKKNKARISALLWSMSTSGCVERFAQGRWRCRPGSRPPFEDDPK